MSICSFRSSFYPGSDNNNRNAILHRLVQDCQFSISDLLKLLSHGFHHNFQPYAVRTQLTDSFWQQARNYLDPQGYKYLTKKRYFPR